MSGERQIIGSTNGSDRGDVCKGFTDWKTFQSKYSIYTTDMLGKKSEYNKLIINKYIKLLFYIDVIMSMHTIITVDNKYYSPKQAQNFLHTVVF